MQANIIKLQPEEWQKYKNIRLEALQSDPIAFAETYENALSQPDTYWQERLKNPALIWLFAEVDGRIVGMIGSYVTENKEPPGTAIAVGMFVNEKYRGQGISKKLLHRLIIEIEHISFIIKIKLWVAESQNPARKLYEGMGFKYIGKKAEPIIYNGKKYEELIMEKEIK